MRLSKTSLIMIPAAVFMIFVSRSAQADSCQSIRDALVHLPAQGGEAVIPDGHYVCDKPIILNRSGVTLRGLGNATLRLGDNANSPLVIMGNSNTPPAPVHDVHIANLKIDGNRRHQQMECWGGPCDSGGLANIRNNGVTVRGVVDGSMKNISVVSPRSGGVVTEKGCVRLMIDGLTVTDSEFDGFAGYETTGSTLSHMNLSGNSAAGISIDIRFHGNTIRDSLLSHNGDVGIFMRYANDNRFEDLIIEDSGNHGVFLAAAEMAGTCPINNEFLNLTVLRSHGFGFQLNDECAGNKLTGHAVFQKNTAGCYHEPSAGRVGAPDQITCEN